MSDGQPQGQSARDVENKLRSYLLRIYRDGGERCWWADGAGVSPPTEGNLIKPLIDGKDYFESLLAVIEDAKHYVLIVAFSLTAFFKLYRPGSESETLTDEQLRDYVLWAVVKRVTTRSRDPIEVRVILWHGVVATFRSEENEGRRVKNVLEAAGGAGGFRRGRCSVSLYNKHSALAGLHQKAVVIDGRIAFCGGIDLTADPDADRWDTRSHFKDDKRRAKGSKNWHDVQARVEGPAVGVIQENLRRRWELQTGEKFDVALMGPSSPKDKKPLVKAQVIRTIPQASSTDVSEYSEFESWGRAIINAREFIYIENQYFSCTELLGLLNACLTNNRQLHLIVLLPRDIEAGMRWGAYLPHEQGVSPADAIKKLSIGDKASRVFFAYPVNAKGHPVYVHAKIMIVDDTYATIGSANFNRRAMTAPQPLRGEEELGIAWVDTSDQTVRRFREDLWAEHLQLEREQLGKMDDVTGAALLALWRSRSKSRIRQWSSKQ